MSIIELKLDCIVILSSEQVLCKMLLNRNWQTRIKRINSKPKATDSKIRCSIKRTKIIFQNCLNQYETAYLFIF